MLNGKLKRTIYNNAKANSSDFLTDTNPVSINDKNTKCDIVEFNEVSSSYPISISYISDIHLNHMLVNNFPKKANNFQIKKYLEEICSDLAVTFQSQNSSLLLICGDVSFNFNLATLFYTELTKHIKGHKIFVVLGNHDYWDHIFIYRSKRNKTNPIEETVSAYKALFNQLEINLLNNDIYFFQIPNFDDYYHEWIIDKYSFGSLKSLDNDKIKKLKGKTLFCILGGTGFSGLNKKYNATIGLYRDALTDLETDVKMSSFFYEMYEYCLKMFSSINMIVLTHNPISDWNSTGLFHDKGIYVNGHTHHNDLLITNTYKIYANNQIGYNSKRISLKRFFIDGTFDIFESFSDGILKITRQQYLDFYTNKRMSVTFNRTGYNLFMIKRNNLYCFIAEKDSSNKLYFLNGGQMKLIKPELGLSYFFHNLGKYSSLLDTFLENYTSHLKNVSDFVQSFGGDGTIHGCIVDIDYYNHLYVNPINGEVFPYFANTIVDKYVFINVASLLSAHRPSLFSNFMQKYVTHKSENEVIPFAKGPLKIEKKGTYFPDTSMYKYSRVIYSIQYKSTTNVIRLWNDDLLNSNDAMHKISNDSNKNIFLSIASISIE